MKMIRHPLALLLAFGLVLPVLPLPAEDHGHTELGEQMEVIGKTFRSLRRAVRDPAKNAEAAEMAGEMLAAARASIDHDPAWTADQPAAEQADFVAGYKKEMQKFIDLLTELKAALEADDNEKANELVDALRDQQRSSHKAYKKPDED